MCTLSFAPADGGFLLAMNRDEQRTRPRAAAPSIHTLGEQKALFPSEPSGGTWIGINESGLCLALINWYSRPQLPGAGAFSRGNIIPELLSRGTWEKAEHALLALPLPRLQPFRLFMMTRELGVIREFRSEGAGLEIEDHPWTIAHWFSSGHDEDSATRSRGGVCLAAVEESDAGTLPWLARLHSAHGPEKGADSICMHRNDAVTVSMTLLRVASGTAIMTYHEGSPCEPSHRMDGTLELRARTNHGEE